MIKKPIVKIEKDNEQDDRNGYTSMEAFSEASGDDEN